MPRPNWACQRGSVCRAGKQLNIAGHYQEITPGCESSTASHRRRDADSGAHQISLAIRSSAGNACIAAAPAAPYHRRPRLPDTMPAPTPKPDSHCNPQLSRALDRLGDAFHAFPEDQRDLLHEINVEADPMACPLAWNDVGVPSLFVGGKKRPSRGRGAESVRQRAGEIERRKESAK